MPVASSSLSVATAAAVSATNGSYVWLYCAGSSPPAGYGVRRLTGMWVCSGKNSDSKPRSSTSLAIVAGIGGVVGREDRDAEAHRRHPMGRSRTSDRPGADPGFGCRINRTTVQLHCRPAMARTHRPIEPPKLTDPPRERADAARNRARSSMPRGACSPTRALRASRWSRWPEPPAWARARCSTVSGTAPAWPWRCSTTANAGFRTRCSTARLRSVRAHPTASDCSPSSRLSPDFTLNNAELLMAAELRSRRRPLCDGRVRRVAPARHRSAGGYAAARGRRVAGAPSACRVRARPAGAPEPERRRRAAAAALAGGARRAADCAVAPPARLAWAMGYARGREVERRRSSCWRVRSRPWPARAWRAPTRPASRTLRSSPARRHSPTAATSPGARRSTPRPSRRSPSTRAMPATWSPCGSRIATRWTAARRPTSSAFPATAATASDGCCCPRCRAAPAAPTNGPATRGSRSALTAWRTWRRSRSREPRPG